ncbi:uncharacterized protein [Temnothorax longispinosus]|uniref:uncharacterized protein n=1 Tax=Temnothorax longispinosus TaxID=300112 RepID=UPI003A99EFF3
MPRKGKKNGFRHSRPRKRSFQGNQFTAETETASTSNAAKKLKTADDDIIISQTHGYRIIEFFTVFSALTQMLICKNCKKNVTFGETGSRGLGFKIAVTCSCGVRKIDSGPFINSAFEINRRIIFVMGLLGVCKEGINLFCGLMDMCQNFNYKVYYASVENIYTASKGVFHILCHKAVKEEIEVNMQKGKPSQNLIVSGDGTWKKRGFSSLFGVTTLIGQNTGKIIDLVVKSSHCQSCIFWKNKKGTVEYSEWFEDHKETCSINHSGSFGKMEVDSMKEMFSRSEEQFGVRYCNYIGDGDSKTFKALMDLQPYGEDITLKKHECVGHVEKRMGTRLRNIKKAAKLGGKGKLTDTLIKKLTKYYGLAIRRHPDSVEEMKKAIMATYYHLCSTDEKPQHEYCPTGCESWCKWRVAEATGKLTEFEHPPAFHKDVQEQLLSIYQDLSKDDLLERCLGGYTQNSNESFNASLWRLAPKHLHCGAKTIEISAYFATAIFNEGYYPILKIMEAMGIVIGQHTKRFVDSQNDKRLRRAEIRTWENTKEARTANRMQKTAQQKLYEEEEGILYGPGIAD